MSDTDADKYIWETRLPLVGEEEVRRKLAEKHPFYINNEPLVRAWLGSLDREHAKADSRLDKRTKIVSAITAVIIAICTVITAYMLFD